MLWVINYIKESLYPGDIGDIYSLRWEQKFIHQKYFVYNASCQNHQHP